MMKKFKKQINNEKGLTLIELLAVIVILAIVAAIAVPAIGNIIQNSKEKAVIADAQMVLSAANLYFVENPEKTEVFVDVEGKTDILIPEFLDDAGTITAVTVTETKAAGGNTISFTGTAGKITKSFTGETKDSLSNINFEVD